MLNHTFIEEARKLQPELISQRHYLHAHPETAFQLSLTKEFVRSELKSMGYEPTDCGKAGITVTVGTQNPDKTFLIRGDMDALPIKEETNLDFAASNGCMHACGHDMHTTMLLGAARLLKEHESEIRGTIKLMFQPAEEILEGAKDMIDAGVLKNPDVDAALMIHVLSEMPFSSGTAVIAPPGISAPSADFFEIHVQGKGCHGSMPYTGTDPLLAASHILIALQEIQTRELPLSQNAILTFGMIQGGTAPNIIPDKITMFGSFRTFDEDARTYIKNRLEGISSSIASAHRCSSDISFTRGCPALINDENLCADTEKYLRELLGENSVFSSKQLRKESSERPSDISGSEDFAYVSQEIPSVMIAIAAGTLHNGCSYPQHHPKVQFDDEILYLGSAVYAYTALRWLEEHK
ncbi:MAG: M20 family metallopeptidase [Schaedlerella sp.]|nr:M20 family metallopeptidase [Schaedlerella sp.]